MFTNRSFNPSRSLIRGVIAVLAGGAIIFTPDLTLEIVMRILGALMLADGLINYLMSQYVKSKQQGAFVIVPRGVSNIVVGGILILFPALLVNLFVFVMGLILIIAGFSQLMAQLQGRGRIGFSIWVTILAALALITGIAFMTKPFKSAENMMIIVGVIVSLYGAGQIVWSFMVRKGMKQNPVQKQEDTIIDAEYEEVE